MQFSCAYDYDMLKIDDMFACIYVGLVDEIY